MKRKIDMLIVHCDANQNPNWGLKELRILHEQRGFGGIGYHFWIDFDGRIFKTRPLNTQGAHAFGKNATSIGICLHGKIDFTEAQFESLKHLLIDLCLEYKIEPDHIYPHNKFSIKKCPNFDLEPIKDEVNKKLKGV